jgi:sugar lactone lactonase YvrE
VPTLNAVRLRTGQMRDQGSDEMTSFDFGPPVTALKKMQRCVWTGLCGVAILLAFAVPRAEAARIHPLLSSTTLPPDPDGNLPGVLGVATDRSTHRIYVTSFNNGGTQPTYILDGNGILDEATPELTGGVPTGQARVAVDNSDGPSAGDIYVATQPPGSTENDSGYVERFDPDGAATSQRITKASVPANGTPQSDGRPPVVNDGPFRPNAVAVDDDGNVFVSDAGGNGAASTGAIDEFTASGAFVAQLAAGKVSGTNGIALDSSGHIFTTSLGIFGLGTGLFELDAKTGECIPVSCAPIESEQTNGVAVDDADGTVLAAGQRGANSEGWIKEFDIGTRELIGTTQPPDLFAPAGIAFDEGNGHVIVDPAEPFSERGVKIFGAVEVVPDVEILAPEDVDDESALLKGRIGAAEVPGATCVFQYVEAEAFAKHGFEEAAEAPCGPAGPFTGSAMNAVEAHLTGLRGGTTYRARLLGRNSNGSNPSESVEFTTLGPAVTGTEAVEVDETAATLTALINPNLVAPTSYRFQYLSLAQFESGGWGRATEVPSGGGTFGLSATGTGDLKAGVSATGSGTLSAGTSAIGSGDLSTGSKEVSALDTEEGTFEVGQPITGEGIPAGTTIAAVGSGTLTLSASASAAGSGVELAAGSILVTGLSTALGTFEVGQPITGDVEISVVAGVSTWEEGIADGTSIVAVRPGTLVLSAPAKTRGSFVALTAGSTLVASLDADSGGFRAGQAISGPGIPHGTTVRKVSVGGKTLVLSAPAGETHSGAELAATEALRASERIEGLPVKTLYRFRVLAENSEGMTEEEGTFETFGASTSLPDNRRYEQVSPIAKNGSSVQGEPNAVAASPDGERLTFFSQAGISGGVGAQNYPSYLSTRAPGGWSTQGLLPPASAGRWASVVGWSEDLLQVYDFASSTTDGTNLLLRSSEDGGLTRIAGGEAVTGANPFDLAGSAADGSVALLESRKGGILPGDQIGKQNVYVYGEASGAFALAGVMNDGSVPPGGTMAGPYDWYTTGSPSQLGGALDRYYTQAEHAISADGTKVFFTAGETGQLYVRMNPLAAPQELGTDTCLNGHAACTVRISAPESGVSDPGTPAGFIGASADGSVAYFVDRGKLTEDGSGGSGFNLYRYDLQSGHLTDLTIDNVDRNGARVTGVLGVSASGQDVYFVAIGGLAGAGQAPAGQTNLYQLHGDTIHFITRLANSTEESRNWIPGSSLGLSAILTMNSARLSRDGQTLLFRAQQQLTSYRNHGVAELYLYRSGQGIDCVSCNPAGEKPAGPAGVQEIPSGNFPISQPAAILSRNLSPDGRRVIFDSADQLVAADQNNANDVYEWEADGKGSCQSEAEGGGCIYLISGGAKGAGASYFADADEEGEDIFFLTGQALVAQDKDELVDVYDARVNGGIPAQEAVPPVPCEGEAGCLGAVANGPGPTGAGTSSFQGPGNPKPPAACKKGQVRKGGKCVKKKSKHKAHHHKKKKKGKGGSKHKNGGPHNKRAKKGGNR